MKTNGNEPAFSTVDTIHPVTGERFDPINPGLTKIEYASFMAMQGILANTADYSLGHEERVAEMSVKHAKALINELNKEA